MKDGDYVVFESVAVLYYLDVKYPQAPIFGLNPEEAGVIMRVICEFQAYAEPSLLKIVERDLRRQVADDIDELTDAMHVVGREARTIEGRLSKEQWIVGAELFRRRHGDFPVDPGAAPRVESEARRRSSARAFCPWSATIRRSRAGFTASNRLPGYERTYPPHWRENAVRRET